MADRLTVGIAGATGYTGSELVRLLLAHPRVELAVATSEHSEGQSIGEALPGLRNLCDLPLTRLKPEALAERVNIAFLALPHTTSAGVAAALVAHGTRVIDLSADFRLRTTELYETWYKVPHQAPDLLREAVYGLPELYRERLRHAALVAVPGCYSTGAILGVLPLLREGIVDPESLIVDAASGTSGAGRKADLALTFSEVHQNLKAYAVASHRHTPEIEQVLGEAIGRPIRVTFTPHLVPTSRGILSTIYTRCSRPVKPPTLRDCYRKTYAGEPFVRICPLGQFPETKQVLGSNYCDIGVTVDERTGWVISVSAIDNLGKGAAGQAVQVMNLMAGLPETSGLGAAALFP
ncbi:MAG: N-acetyl-gamma-glutamyl-phosphate reductase [Candidatus Methylomirabilales bacterium]